MKKLILFLALVIVSYSFSIAQGTNEFIEIIVEDTIQFEPEKIVYTIYMPGSLQEYETTDTTESAIKTKAANKPLEQKKLPPHEKLKLLIKKLNIDTISGNQFDLSDGIHGISNDMVLLRFTSNEKLKDFISHAKNIEGLTGLISSMISSKTDNYKKILTSRLIDKAEEDAKFIAQQCKRTLGSIIQIREETSEISGGWTSYPPLSALAQESGGSYLTDKIIFKRKLLIRFSW